MTMNVTTPPASATVPADASATAQPGTPTEGLGDQFADALAGFLGDAPTGQDEPSGPVETSPVPVADPATVAVVALVPLLGLVPTVIASAKAKVAVAALADPTGTQSAATVLGASTEQARMVRLVGRGTEGDPVPGAVNAITTPSTTVPTGTAPEVLTSNTTATPAITPAPTPAPTATVPTAPITSGAHGAPSTTEQAVAVLSSLGVSIVATESPAKPFAAPMFDDTTVVSNGTTPTAPLDGQDPTASLGGPAPIAPAAVTIPVTPTTVPRPVQVAQQVATQVAFLSGAVDGSHTMTLQITPDDLGPVQVQVTITDGAVDMTLLAAHEVGRDTLTQAAPELRRYLEAAGLTCNSVEVDLDNEQSSWFTQPDADRDSEAHQPSNRREQAGTPSGDDSESTNTPADTATRNSTSTGVDLRL